MSALHTRLGRQVARTGSDGCWESWVVEARVAAVAQWARDGSKWSVLLRDLRDWRALWSKEMWQALVATRPWSSERVWSAGAAGHVVVEGHGARVPGQTRRHSWAVEGPAALVHLSAHTKVVSTLECLLLLLSVATRWCADETVSGSVSWEVHWPLLWCLLLLLGDRRLGLGRILLSGENTHCECVRG